MRVPARPNGKFTGLAFELPHAGRLFLGGVVAQTTETSLYATSSPGIVVKMFDLTCDKADEISYGPYLGFKLELANYEEINKVPDVAPFVPAYHGAHIDYERKYAGIAMEFLHGKDLKAWCEEGVIPGQESERLEQFQRAIYETLAIIRLFHAHSIILLDLKPENILRLRDGAIRIVDLGAFFTPRHAQDLASYVYSATPEHAEVLIDASNLQAGLPPTQASDVFSAGVALFELATGTSRLLLNDSTAQEILAKPELYRFLDSQIRDVWRAFPHLAALLPLVQTQLAERRLLFSEMWHVLKAYVARQAADWESLTPAQQDELLLATGSTIIQEQLPPLLSWLGGPIARATALRSAWLKNIAELMRLVASPIPEAVQADLQEHNCFLKYLAALELPADFMADLNTWDVRLDPRAGHWAITAGTAGRPLADSAQYVFLKRTYAEEAGHRFYQVVDELEASDQGDGKLTLGRLLGDRQAWLG